MEIIDIQKSGKFKKPGEKTVLLIDYDVTVTRLYSKVLELCGYKVDTANRGMEALDLIKKKNYSIVIVDVSMPEMEGYETLLYSDKKIQIPATLLLAAIGRICHPTSKRNWYQGWARYTSLSFLIRMFLTKLDSQHFWDQMDALPIDTLLCDTTNFFTYIDSVNENCRLAQRSKNKQKRMDLKQFGLLIL